MKYTIGSVEYTSKSALQREWRSRVKRLYTQHTKGKKSKKNRLLLTGSDADFFVEVAYLFEKQRCRLYPTLGQSLTTCKASTVVFLAKAGTAFGSYRGKRVSKYMADATCVFFGCAADNTRYRSVSSALGDTCSAPTKPGQVTPQVAAWMRREIQHQIDRFRKEQKKGIITGTYKCKLCGRALGRVESHVDHGTGAKSFKSISLRFQTEKLMRPVTVCDMTDPTIGKLWRNFHLRNATLAMTCRDCNLRNK